MSERVIKDMALTVEDFARLLPRALDGWPYDQRGTAVEVGTPEHGARIELAPLPARRYGLLEITRSQVAIEFRGLDPATRAQFLDQFDRAFQRGGG